MHSALGHCQDPECLHTPSTHDLVRLFRCSIHCDRNLCLYHLNAHNICYEQERKQNEIIIKELQNSLTLYQTVFEQHMITYRELVRQASGILLHNTSSLVPVDQIRPVLENIQQAIAIFQQEIIVIKCEPSLNSTTVPTEAENEINKSVTDTNTTVNTSTSTINEHGCQNFVVRVARLDHEINTESAISIGNTNREERPVEDEASPVYKKRVSDAQKKGGRPVKRLQK